MAQGDAFVCGACLLKAGANGCDHMVSTGECLLRIGSSPDGERVSRAMSQLAAKRAYQP